MREILFLFFMVFCSTWGFAQSVHFQKSHPAYHIFDRLDIKYNSDHNIHTGVKHYSRKRIMEYLGSINPAVKVLDIDSLKSADFRPISLQDLNGAFVYIYSDNELLIEEKEYHIDRSSNELVINNIEAFQDDIKIHIEYPNINSNNRISTLDHASISYLYEDNIELSPYDHAVAKKETGIWRHFYKSKANFLELRKRNFDLFLNPIINFRLGKEANAENPVFQNTRGFEMRMMLDKKVYVYTSVFENQAKFYNFIERVIDEQISIPGQGFFKKYQSAVLDQFSGWDYLNADAYIGFPISKHLGIEFGHSSHFIGNGYRSLLLSDYANNYFYLKLQANIWKFHYQTIFSELAPLSTIQNPNDVLLAKKYSASHYLSYKPHRNFEIGIFESVIFARANHFEFQYLNPVILYRTVEQLLDSPDNVIIGINGKWNMFNALSLYGQLVVDEFKLSEIRANDGWWANKYGLQAGAKYIDAFGVDQLDLQAEFNAVRPFTYSHKDTLEGFADISVANYSHHGLPLAHPLGSNFMESVFRVQYVPHQKVKLESKLLYAIKGENEEGENFGADILIPLENRTRDYGFGILDGTQNKILSLSFEMSYMFKHNYFIDFNYLYRTSKSDDITRNLNTNYVGIGFRINTNNYKIDY